MSDPVSRRSAAQGRFTAASSSRRNRRTTAVREQPAPPPQPGLRFLIDNSVWSRLASSPEVAEAFRALVNSARPAEVLICPPVAAEYGYSTRSGADHTTLISRLAVFADCQIAPTTADVLQIQNALWNGGLLRAVGAMDTLIASYGIANQATVVHYDRDYEHIAAVVPNFEHRWILPRGTI